ncbi:MAG TPA: PIG-L family deacetylase [Ktedonobacteraceae bacterium]|nr:PIG-L family deacetylase [Ktedonobacteraceae bacterium]
MASALLRSYAYARKKITHENYDYIYLSPHLDDVTLSCGGSICTYQAQGWRVLVVTLLSGEPQTPSSPLAQACHQLWQIPEGVSPYQIRKAEDEQAMAALGVDYLWLNWLEVIYRVPDLSDLSEINNYQVDFQHDPLFPTLCQWFVDLHTAYPDARIVVPLGVGGHRDHRLVFQAALAALDRTTLCFFEDFPYVAYLPEEVTELARVHHLVPLEVDVTACLQQRIRAVACYQSQHAMLFYPPTSFPELIKEYAQMRTHCRFVERYWKFAL